MKIQALVPLVVVFGGLMLAHRPAHAATISIQGHSPNQVKANCSGGSYFAPSRAGVYGCIAQDGSGIVCGGTGDNYKHTCDTFGPIADAAKRPRPRLPTRKEVDPRLTGQR